MVLECDNIFCYHRGGSGTTCRCEHGSQCCKCESGTIRERIRPRTPERRNSDGSSDGGSMISVPTGSGRMMSRRHAERLYSTATATQATEFNTSGRTGSTVSHWAENSLEPVGLSDYPYPFDGRDPLYEHPNAMIQDRASFPENERMGQNFAPLLSNAYSAPSSQFAQINVRPQPQRTQPILDNGQGQWQQPRQAQYSQPVVRQGGQWQQQAQYSQPTRSTLQDRWEQPQQRRRQGDQCQQQ